jgi:hypothetical protein
MLTNKLFIIPQCNMSRSFFYTKRKSRISSTKEIPGSEQRLDVPIELHDHHFFIGDVSGFLEDFYAFEYE